MLVFSSPTSNGIHARSTYDASWPTDATTTRHGPAWLLQHAPTPSWHGSTAWYDATTSWHDAPATRYDAPTSALIHLVTKRNLNE